MQQNAHTYGGCKARSSTQAPRLPPTKCQVHVCLSGPEEEKNKCTIWWLIVYRAWCVQALYFGVSFFPSLPSFTYLPAPEVGPANRFEILVQRNAAARMEWDEGCNLGAGAGRDVTPGRGSWLCSGLPEPARGGVGRGRKICCSKHDSGRERHGFYKFLNLRVCCNNCNVHSICCEVSTENMHRAY